MIIDIGAGTSPTTDEPSIILDPVHGEGVWRRKAEEVPWPVHDNRVDAVFATHVMEHIPAGQPRIDVFNEVYRVLKPGKRFQVCVPALFGKNGLVTWHSIADPTHVSYWCIESFSYFDGSSNQGADYGIKPWKTIFVGYPRMEWEICWVGTPVN